MLLRRFRVCHRNAVLRSIAILGFFVDWLFLKGNIYVDNVEGKAAKAGIHID